MHRLRSGLFSFLYGQQLQRYRVPAACCFLLLSQLVAHAQTVNASLRGTVTDPSSGVVPLAQVELREPATGRTVGQATSNASGDFEFDELKPGSYELHCTATGFKQFVAQNIVLDSGQVRRVDAPLAVGEQAQEVTVMSGAAVIATESATISDVVTAKQFEESPQVLIYPTAYSILTTLAGFQGGFGSPVANGQTQAQQTQTFDGIPNDLGGEQSNNANFFDEFSATLFNAPAESPVPVQLNDTTKRGSNSFHGSARYRIYDSVFDARGYFDPGKTAYLQHEWNLEGGGPIWKDHTFFYGQWFAQRIPLGTAIIANVPTASYRSGVFPTTITDPTTGKPFPNNTIPQNRISPVALAFQNNYLPAPNVGDPSQPVDNYSFHFPFNSDLYRGDWPMARVDHQLTSKNSLFVRWLMRETPYVLNNGLPDLVWTRKRKHQQWATGDTHLFTPQLINNFRFGYSSDYIVDGQTEAGRTPPDGSAVLATTGLLGSNPSNSKGQGFPEVDISGLTSLLNVPGGVKSDNHIIDINDSLNWQIGRHVYKFGGSIQRFGIYRGFVPDYGAFNFDGSITGNPYADFLLGMPQQSQRTNPLSGRSQALTEYGLYAEDSFKITRRLNLDYGLRWDLYGTPSASDNLEYNFDPTTGDVIVDPKAIANVSPLYPSTITVKAGDVQAQAQKSNFVPRFGAAFQLNDHSVLRGGYGIYISRFGGATGLSNNIPTGLLNNFLPINPQLGSTGPFSLTETYQNQITPISFPDPYPSTTSGVIIPSQSVIGYPRQISHGHIQQYSATYETEFAKIGLRTSYVGSHSSGLNYQVNTNIAPLNSSLVPGSFDPTKRPYPQFVTTTLLRFDGSATYDSFQAEVKRRVGQVTFNGSYSLSRSKANDLDTENPYDVLSHWANDGLTRRHYGVASVIWALPFGQGQQYLNHAGDFVNRVVGGWSTNVITYAASGLYFSPSYTGADASNTGTIGGLPDLVGDPNNIPGGKSKTNWFNTAAFAVPQANHFGDALPNSLESQNLYVTHLSIVKVTPITERAKFNFTAQISNLFNHAQFLTPSGDITNPGGNQFTSQFGVFDSLETARARQITFQGGVTF